MRLQQPWWRVLVPAVLVGLVGVTAGGPMGIPGCARPSGLPYSLGEAYF
jgi:hypothetical protein